MLSDSFSAAVVRSLCSKEAQIHIYAHRSEACEVLMFYRIRVIFRTRLVSLYDMLGHKSAFINSSYYQEMTCHVSWVLSI